MKRQWKRLEIFVDKIIPYLLVILLIIIILDIFFKEIIEPFHLYVEIIDYIIIAFFVVDLIFKYLHSRKITDFFKHNWIEIIAVLPVFLVARIIEETVGFFLAAEDIARVQRIVHEGVKVEEEGAKIAQELGRSSRFTRFIRPFARLPRFIKAFDFYKHPKKH